MSARASNLRLKRLAAGLSAAVALIGMQSHAFAFGIDLVTSCADDGAPGTLRQVVANAASGDHVDMSTLLCLGSTITLTQGEIAIAQDLTLAGAIGSPMTIANSGGRVLHSTSTDLSLANLIISGGSVYTTDTDADGGCILATGNVSLVGSTVSNCIASSSNASARGGAVNALTVSLVSSRISGSAANSTGFYQVARGGGVYAAGLACTDSTLSGNSVRADVGEDFGQGGGALVADGSVYLSRCTIDSNTAGEGGGIMQFVNNFGYSPITRIQNSTISGNTATYATGGVAVFCPKCTPSPVQIFNSTVAFNRAPSGYGVGIFTNGSVVAQSSILANNTNNSGIPSFDDLFATDLSGADNLIASTNVTPAAGVITVTTDPMLAPLAGNGGPTRTHALLSTSPALDRGNNSAALATDQRGFARSVLGSVDIGAWERQLFERPSSAETIFAGSFD